MSIPSRSRRGSTLIEFSLIATLLFMVVFLVIEFSRMLLVYTGVANAARAGVRYAIVHGSSRTGSGVDGPSSSADSSQVQTVVNTYANAAMMNTGLLTVHVTYPDSSNAPGSRVRVAVSYAYDPFSWASAPLSVNLGSQAQGIIEF